MSLLPPNATLLERAMELATLGGEAIEVPIRDLVDPDRCPLRLLPYLAWALSIDTWSADWPERVKRARVRSAIEIQRRKGTARSVRDVVASFGGAVAIREWWQMAPRGAPHTFALVLALDGIVGPERTAAYVDAVIDEVRRTKPVRSHFTFTQSIASAGGIGLVGAVRAAIVSRLDMTA